MRHRHPLPRIWLMTDERINDLDCAISRLPRGSGIVFRHYSLSAKPRKTLFKHLLRLARRSRHIVILAGTPQQAIAWGADGAHDRSALRSKGLRTAAVHNVPERVAAIRGGADLIFVSPIFETRSHSDARTLGWVGFGLVSGHHRTRAIALGGMSARRAKRLKSLRVYGWAAIDALNI